MDSYEPMEATAGCPIFTQMSPVIMDCAADPWPRHKDVPQIPRSSIMLTSEAPSREKEKMACKQITSSFIIWKKNVIEERRKEIFGSILGPAVAVLQGLSDSEQDTDQELRSCLIFTSLMLFLVFYKNNTDCGVKQSVEYHWSPDSSRDGKWCL